MEQATLTKANTYTIDPNHSTVHFWVRHLMVSKVHGELSDIKGTIAYDAARPQQAQIDVTIDASSLTTRQEQRDAHLKSADFLEVDKFPTISFKSTKVIGAGANEFEIWGDLTIRGVTREVVFKAEITPEARSPFGGYLVGITASGIIDREDFGLTWNQLLETGGVAVGKEVHFQIDAELNRPE